MSADPEDKYFADGMTEELISTVSKIGELAVISRTSIMRYRDAAVPISQIGEELSVGSVLEGSVRKAGNRVRITTQLIHVQSDKHVWSQSYDRDLTDVFAIQGDIANQVAEALKVNLLSKEKAAIDRRPTTNTEAYILYLKGRYYWNERTEEGLKKSESYFKEAARLDPDFALAYSGLADSYNIMLDYAWMAPDKAGPLARENTSKALVIDDSLAEAHASLGLVLQNYYWDFPAAEREYRRAIELKPNYASAHQWYGILLFTSKRFDESYVMIERAYQLDPYSRILGLNLANALYVVGKSREAFERWARVAEFNPDFPSVFQWRSGAYVATSEYVRAIEDAKKFCDLDKNSAFSRLSLAWVYARSGQKDIAERILDEVLLEHNRGYLSPSSVGMVFLALGDKAEGYRWLERGLMERDNGMLYLRAIPWVATDLDDPRWSEIERKIGF